MNRRKIEKGEDSATVVDIETGTIDWHWENCPFHLHRFKLWMWPRFFNRILGVLGSNPSTQGQEFQVNAKKKEKLLPL